MRIRHFGSLRTRVALLCCRCVSNFSLSLTKRGHPTDHNRHPRLSRQCGSAHDAVNHDPYRATHSHSGAAPFSSKQSTILPRLDLITDIRRPPTRLPDVCSPTETVGCCNGRDLYRRRCHTRSPGQTALFSPSKKRLQSGPEESRARLLGAAKQTLDAEDRFEMIEKGGEVRDKSWGGIRFDSR